MNESHLDRLSRDLQNTARDVPTHRGEADAMFDTEEHYLSVGSSALRAVQLALLSAGKTEVGRILDFACGHGRVLRHLRAAFPNAELVASDIDEDGVRYCAEHFGATPVVSTPAMDVELPGPFDLIWVGSLLTHLDSQGWQRFIALVLPTMARGGVLVFTTHGRIVERNMAEGTTYLLRSTDVESLLAEHAETGFAYRDYPDTPGYGVSLSSIPWITRQLHDLEALRLVHYAEGAWDGHQDVVACQRI